MPDPYVFTAITNGGTISGAATTPANVPNLVYNVVAGGTYEFAAYVPWQAGTASATVKSCMGGTCTASMVVYATALNIGVDGNGSTWVQSSLTLGSGARASAAAVATATTYWITIKGRIVVTGSGTLTVQVGSGTGTINVQSGGHMTLQQVG